MTLIQLEVSWDNNFIFEDAQQTVDLLLVGAKCNDGGGNGCSLNLLQLTTLSSRLGDTAGGTELCFMVTTKLM